MDRKLGGIVLKVLGGLLVACLAGCSSSHVLVGKQRPPIDPDQVQVYAQAPEKYEQIAILEASNIGKPSFTAQGSMNTVIARLKKEAASLGANGIVIQGFGESGGSTVTTSTGTVTGSSYTGMGVGVSPKNKTGSAIAIYVEPR